MDENQISRVVVDRAIEVHRVLGGPGLLESVYEEALAWELVKAGIRVERQFELPITYKSHTLGTRLRIDLLVSDLVIVECKATSEFNPIQSSKSKRLRIYALPRRSLEW